LRRDLPADLRPRAAPADRWGHRQRAAPGQPARQRFRPRRTRSSPCEPDVTVHGFDPEHAGPAAAGGYQGPDGLRRAAW